MNSRIIINLSLFGLFAGGASVFGLLSGNDWLLWLAFWIFASIVLTKKVTEKYFLNAVFTGFGFTFLSYLIQVLLFDQFVQNNPGILETLKGMEQNPNPRVFLLSMGLLVSLGCGIFLGFLTIGVKKFFGR